MKYLVMVGLVGLAVVFQNCSDQSFSSRADMNKPLSVESEQLVEEEIPDIIKDDVDDVLSEDPDDDHEVVKEEPKKYDKDDDDDKDSTKEDPKKYSNHDDDDDDKEHSKDKKQVSCKNRNDGNARFVCVLAGAGKSTHVAVVDDKIMENNSTPKTACMSEHACEEIVGKKLSVKSVESRGYCKNGTPQVLALSDADIQRLMDKAK
jgi:hypothetical protein